jgi:hypothetical protein
MTEGSTAHDRLAAMRDEVIVVQEQYATLLHHLMQMAGDADLRQRLQRCLAELEIRLQQSFHRRAQAIRHELFGFGLLRIAAGAPRQLQRRRQYAGSS